MFPERGMQPDKSRFLTVYRGHKLTISIRLVADDWIYRLQENETLTVEVRDSKNSMRISKNFTSADVDADDALIIVDFSEAETESLESGDYYIFAYVDGYVIFKPQKIIVKGVVEHDLL